MMGPQFRATSLKGRVQIGVGDLGRPFAEWVSGVYEAFINGSLGREGDRYAVDGFGIAAQRSAEGKSGPQQRKCQG